MKTESNGPIINRGESEGKKYLLILIVGVMFATGIAGFLLLKTSPSDDNQEIEVEKHLPIVIDDLTPIITNNQKVDSIKQVEIPTAIIKEEGTVDFFYQRALKKEEDKDYQGAVEYYTKTIELAKKYSSEMWNSLNNRGIIKAKQFNDYKGALADFNKIIQLETNRSDGEINAIRLESGYTNRAYVKKMKGDKDGACDDLYEAQALGVESSATFIEKQIAKICQ